MKRLILIALLLNFPGWNATASLFAIENIKEGVEEVIESSDKELILAQGIVSEDVQFESPEENPTEEESGGNYWIYGIGLLGIIGLWYLARGLMNRD